MTKPLYVLLKNDSPEPTLWEEWDKQTFKALKESLINPPALGHPNYQIPFLIFEKEGNTLGVLTQKHGYYHRPLGYYGQHLGTPLALQALLLLPLWLTPKKKL